MAPDLEENRRLVRRYFDLLSGSDLSRLEEIISPDLVFFGPRAPEGIRGREAFIEFVATLRDYRFTEGGDGRRGKPSGKRVHYDQDA
jgi:ketosteroid isomerase-like protein